MRNVAGAVAPLTAKAFNVDGDVIADAPIVFVYLSSDTTARARTAITLLGGDTVFAADSAPTSGTYRVVAQVGRLQSQPQPFAVVPRPDSVRAGTTVDTIAYGPPTLDSTANVTVMVTHDSADVPAGVPVASYPVTFTLDPSYAPGTVPALADSVFFVNTSGGVTRRYATVVTPTGTDGVATAQVRVYVKEGQTTAVDSVAVLASANYKGVPLRGSPVRLVVPVLPAKPTAPAVASSPR
jgi:hypothetical protein